MFNLFLTFLFLVYNEKLWINYLACDNFLNITGDERMIYVGIKNGILIFDAKKIEYLKSLTKLDGILENLKLIAYDQELNSLWLLDDSSNLMNYSPFTKKKEIFKLAINPQAIGVGKQFLYFLVNEDTFKWDKKKRKLLKIEKTDDTSLFWYGKKKKYLVKNFIFLTPYYYVDENLNKYYYEEVFVSKKNLWVSADDYGILVFDLTTKNLVKVFPFNSILGRIKKIVKFQKNLWLIADDYLIKTDDKIWQWQFIPISFNTKIYNEKENLLKYKFLELFYKKPVTILTNSQDLLAYISENNIYLFLPDYSKPIEIGVPALVENVSFLNDTLVILTRESFYLFDYKNNNFLDFSNYPSELKFGVFSFISLKNVWYLGVRGGFWIYKDNKWKKIILPINDLSEPVRELVSFNTYLITNIKNQIIFFDTKSQLFFFLKKEDGLLDDNIYSLAVDNNKLWITHKKGISVFDLTSLTKRIKK